MNTIEASKKLFFQGRTNDLRLGQCVLSTRFDESDLLDGLGILGSPDDLGVSINLGRAGAKDGPDAIRQFFYRMTPSCDSQNSLSIFDFGNVIMTSDIITNHAASFAVVKNISQRIPTLITLGGGHDYSFPHLAGWFAEKTGLKGIISVDPHFDLRETIPSPHSGTGMRQLVNEKVVVGSHLVIFGAAKGRNSRENFTFAQANKVKITWMQDIIQSDSVALFANQLVNLSAKCDHVAVTFDLDACTDALGVSARCVLGFTSREMIQMAYLCGQNRKVDLLDLCEVAPGLETSQSAPAIAAEMMYAFALGKNLI